MEKEILLRKALKANGAFSTLSAIVAFLLTSKVEAVNEMAQGDGLLFGLQMAIFASFVFYNAYKAKISKTMIVIIIALDLLFVVGTIIRMFTEPAISIYGLILLGFVSVVVALLAELQFIGLRRMRKEGYADQLQKR